MPCMRRVKTKRMTRGLDQIHADIHADNHLEQYKKTKAPEDLPGLGRFYCVECGKWFEGENSLVTHRRGKNHKKRVKALQETPYSQQEAEAAIGLTTDNGPLQRMKCTEISMQTDSKILEPS